MNAGSAAPQLDPAAFRAWLVELREVEAGTASEACDCPLARFLASQGHVGVWIGDGSFGLAHVEGNFRLPAWARRFIAQVDKWAERNGDDKTIPAPVARGLLAQVEAGAA